MRASTDASTGPDFLGIGAPICGTTWLYHNLRRHPSVWMSSIKEFHYLDSQRERGRRSRWYRSHLSLFLKVTARRFLSGERPLDLGWWFRYFFFQRSDEWYASMFSGRPGQLCGEITPRYAYVPDPVIEEFSRCCPSTRLILLMRDPIERSWSYATKRLALDQGRHMSEVSSDEVRDFFHRDRFLGGLAAWNDYASIIDRWSRHFTPGRMFFGFYDDLEREPAELIGRVCEFLGIGPLPARQAGSVGKRFSSTTEVQIPIPEDIERHIAARVVEGLERLSAQVGGHACTWLRRAHLAGKG